MQFEIKKIYAKNDLFLRTVFQICNNILFLDFVAPCLLTRVLAGDFTAPQKIKSR